METEKTTFGLRVVTAENVLTTTKIKPWRKTTSSLLLDEYIKRDLTEAEKSDLRFAPKAEVVFLEQPNGKPYTGFRSLGKNWATVFALLPGNLLPIVIEWKHGVEEITIVPPSGVPNKSDWGNAENEIEAMANCARREFEEETGIKLGRVELLGSYEKGVAASSRQTTQRYFPFMGHDPDVSCIGKSKFDETEYIELVLTPLDEWLKMISQGLVFDQCAHSITHLALEQLDSWR